MISSCDSCTVSPCAFDRPHLSEAEQDSLCPDVVMIENFFDNIPVNRPGPNSLSWVAYRQSKLEEIKTLIDKEGPLRLIDVPNFVNISLCTLRQWRHNCLQIETRKYFHNGRYINMLFILSVITIKDKTDKREAARNVDLAAIVALVEEEGPLQVKIVAGRLGLNYNTLLGWVKKKWYFIVEYKHNPESGHNSNYISGVKTSSNGFTK